MSEPVRRYQDADGEVGCLWNGAPMHPQWYLTLEAHPRAEIQGEGEHIPVVARAALAEEKPRLWRLVNETRPNSDRYPSRTECHVPVVAPSPASDG